HYTRLYDIEVNTSPPMPERHWPDQEPLQVDGPLRERLNHWLTLVQCGEVLQSYRVFLGLMQDVPNRRHVLAHLAFAGLIDVQDRMWHNRSYTTGHKGYRARATIELGEALGWDNAHHVLYAGVPDIAVGPRWYSTYELGCNVIQNQLDGRDAELLAQTAPLTPAEEAMLVVVIAADPREAGAVAPRASRQRGGGFDGRLPEGRLRPCPARADPGDRGEHHRQRSAQPGARALHARGLPAHAGPRPRAALAGECPAHGWTSKVRGSAGGVSQLRGGDGAQLEPATPATSPTLA